MISRKYVVSVAILLLILLPNSLVRLPATQFSSAQPPQGNWIVSGQELVQNQSITLNGNLTVESGGNLTLRNVNLTMNAQYNGEYEILVQPGGSIYIYDSVIADSNSIYRFYFIANGSNFVLENSTLHGVGWCSPTVYSNSQTTECVDQPLSQLQSGLVVGTNQAKIEDNLISGNFIGTIVTGSHETIEGNQFTYNDLFALGGYGSSYDSILNNTFVQNPTIYQNQVIYFNVAQNDTFVSNTVVENDTSSIGTNASLSFNARTDGIRLTNSIDSVIENNNISVANIAVFLISSSNSIVVNNNLTNGETGVSILLGGVNTRIERNHIVATPVRGGATYGIYANLAHNSVIDNNTITGDVSEGVYFDHTSNSSLLNNNISQTAKAALALMVFLSSENNSIIGNTARDAQFGMILIGSSYQNLIARNELYADHSITIEGASSNRIFLNNLHDFKGTTGGPYDSGRNIWYNGTEGNYWSYYTGQDQNGNGIGDEQYSRTIVPPNGSEPYYLLNPALITPAAVLPIKPIALPVSGPYNPLLVNITNKVIQIDSGSFPGSLIANSTLLMGKTGPVNFGSGEVTILNSKLIDEGYGFGFNCVGATQCTSILIKNSTLDGAYLADLNAVNITIEDSVITDSAGDGAVSIQGYPTSVTFVNDTISGQANGIRVNPTSISGNVSILGNNISNIIAYAIIVATTSARSIIIANNSIVNCLTLGIAPTANALVMGNRVFGDDQVPLLLGNNSTVYGNTVSDSQNSLSVSGNGNTIYGNNFVNDSNAAYVAGSGNSIYENNFVNVSGNPYDTTGNNNWSYKGEGNYWSSYTGTDANLDGIGDTPFVIGNGAQDNFPFMQPNGWLTKFYLTVQTNLPSPIAFQINGSSFNTETGGAGTFTLGYVTSYALTFPQTVTLSNGTVMVFSHWSDGSTSASRNLLLSSNSTVQVFYQKQSEQHTTTTSASTSVSSSRSSSATASGSNTLTESFSVTTSSKTSSQTTSVVVPPSYTLFIVVGAFAVIIAATTVLALRRKR
ncbi:MAG: right-handed parallel beta-helix repeat-containing protein [Nitrososphaerales archaeon]